VDENLREMESSMRCRLRSTNKSCKAETDIEDLKKQLEQSKIER
ncbi:hypothetical protein CFC21_013690, partial [Triticum aestivum]